MFCPKCGSGLAEGAKFCAKCGATIGAPAPIQATPALMTETPVMEKSATAADAPARGVVETPRNPAAATQGTVCPQCGALNASGAKFCKVDGASLTGEAPAPKAQMRSPARVNAPAGFSGASIGKFAPLIAGGAAVIIAGAAFYAYWTGMIGDRPQQVAGRIEEKLATAGFSSVAVALDREWAATLSGEVKGADGHAAVLKLLEAEKDVKGVTDALVVKPSEEEIRVAVMAAMNANGIGEGSAFVDESGAVTVSGLVNSAQQQDALLTAAKAIAGVTAVNDALTKSAAWVTQDVNRALMLAGLGGLQATASDADHVTLTGQVASASEALRAVEVARNAGPNDVDNKIRIVAPVIAPVAAYAPPANANDPNQMPSSYVGQWGSYGIANGPARYAVIMSFRPGQIGGDVGLAHYGTTSANGRNFTLSCVARLTLKSIENGVITIEETLTQRSIICPGNKIVQLRHDGRALQGEWRRKKDNSVAMTGSLSPGSWNLQ